MSIEVIANNEDFEKLVNNNSCAVVYFGATWCAPCKSLKPKLDEWAESFNNIKFGKIDIDDVPDVTANNHIQSVPTIKFYLNGKNTNTIVGAQFDVIQNALQSFKA